jgi:hypothetical protein
MTFNLKDFTNLMISLIAGAIAAFAVSWLFGFIFPSASLYVFAAIMAAWAWITVKAAIARARARSLGILDEMGRRIWE